MMERAGKAASEDGHSMHALKSPVNKKARWQGSLLLRPAPAVWDASERAHSVRGTVCALALRPQMSQSPSVCPREDTAPAETPCQGVRSPLCCTSCGRRCIPLPHNPRLKGQTGPWSSLGHSTERGKLCRQRGDRQSAPPVLLSSVFSYFPVCLWPERRAFPCCAPLPARSRGSGWAGRVADAAAAWM